MFCFVSVAVICSGLLVVFIIFSCRWKIFSSLFDIDISLETIGGWINATVGRVGRMEFLVVFSVVLVWIVVLVIGSTGSGALPQRTVSGIGWRLMFRSQIKAFNSLQGLLSQPSWVRRTHVPSFADDRHGHHESARSKKKQIWNDDIMKMSCL